MRKYVHNKVQEGQKFTTKQGCVCTVVKYESSTSVHVSFDDGYEKVTTASQLRDGSVKNPYYPSVLGVGYTGEGDFVARAAGKTTNEYSLWHGILLRCYYEGERSIHKAYKDVVVCDEWLNFQNFATWCQDQVGFNSDKWEIDKDVLVRGNKVYSPTTCCFLPQEINRLFSGILGSCYGYSIRENGTYRVRCTVDGKEFTIGHFTCKDKAFMAYKSAKEGEIKRLANKWKNEIDPRAYSALMAFEILQNKEN